MLDNLFLIIAVFATFSGITLPRALSQQPWIVFPAHHLAEPTNVGVLPKPVFRDTPEKIDTDLGPQLSAKSGIVLDAVSGQVLYQKDPDVVLPIASITKLVTAYTAAQIITNWEETYTLQYSDIVVGGSQFAAGVGDTFTKHDLLKAALVGSINQAAQAIAHSTSLSDEDFKAAMNDTATRLGMTNSSFEEPTGLSNQDQSTARDLALLLRSISAQPLLMEPMSQSEHKMLNGNNEITLRTTNDLIRDHAADIVAGKTGFTDAAGNCLATIAEQDGHQLLIVVLGAPDDTSRFTDTQALVEWTYSHYQW
jgi:D-alanyl-D-alanine endopeptidase (penicillin-binding protein 7)